MRWYWIKIGLGALAVFVVGTGIMQAARATRGAVENVTHGGSFTIPLPFVPFQLDGKEVGKFRRVTFHRADGKQVTGVNISVRVSDPSVLERLATGCQLTVNDPHNLGNNSSFECASDAAGMQPFGDVTVQVKDADGDWVTAGSYPFVIPAEAQPAIAEANLTSNMVTVEAEQLRVLADSIARVSAEMARSGVTDRAALRAQLRELRSEMREVEAAVQQMSRTAAQVKVRIPSVEVTVPEAIPTPPAHPDKP